MGWVVGVSCTTMKFEVVQNQVEQRQKSTRCGGADFGEKMARPSTTRTVSTRTRIATRTRTAANGTKIVTTKLVTAPELEWKLQAAAVRRLNEMLATTEKGKFAFAGDMNGVFLKGMQAKVKAKATGLTAGEPDLRFYLPGGVLKSIEMKGAEGRLTDSQKIRHPILRGLGFEIEVVKASTEEEAAEKVEAVVRRWIAANDNHPTITHIRA